MVLGANLIHTSQSITTWWPEDMHQMRLEPRWERSKPPSQPIELQLIDILVNYIQRLVKLEFNNVQELEPTDA